jgi:phosphohistidine phosphatase SixA
LGAAFELGLCSPLVRAQQTAQLVWQELALDASLTPTPDLAAGACPESVLRAIREGLAVSPTAQSVLVVGHLPDLSQTMFHCIGHAAPRIGPFLPAAVTRLDFAEQPSAGTAALAWMKVPEEIAGPER